MGRKPITTYDEELHSYFEQGFKSWTAYTKLNLQNRLSGLPDLLSYNTVQLKYKAWLRKNKPWEMQQYQLPHEIARKTLFRRNKKVTEKKGNNNDKSE